MKITYRIPTEQYAYVEIEDEVTEGFFDPEKMRDQYETFKEAFNSQASPGLSVKEFNACIDRYLTDGTGETAKYLAMSPAQQEIIQCIKRAYKRLESK